MFEVQEALDAQKEEFARREDAFRRREEGLRKKDLELQESLIKFNKFLQENESKRNRAIKRANDEKKQREAKEQEILRLKAQLEDNKNMSRELSNNVQKMMKYTRYLETVQEDVPEDYPEIADLLNRYKTLKDANEDLGRRQNKHDSENEGKRNEFANVTKVKQNTILNSNNEIASLQKKLEHAEQEVLVLQNDVDLTIQSTSGKTLDLGQILMAVENLLQRSTSGNHGKILKHGTDTEAKSGNTQKVPAQQASHGHGPGISELDKQGQKAIDDLGIIAAYMVDFKNICQDLENQVKTNRRAQQAAVATTAAMGTTTNAAPSD